MTKSFQAILAESDDEFVYTIMSTVNLHHDEVLERIRFALLGWDLRDMEVDFVKPTQEANKEFPNAPNTPTYAVKATMGFSPSRRDVEQRVALLTNIPHQVIKVKLAGEDRPKEDDRDYQSLADTALDFSSPLDDSGFSDADARAMVGVPRLGAFMKELEAERKAREPKEVRPVYESYVTSHLGLSGSLGRGVKRGYYVVESFRDKPNQITIEGPFRAQPDNYEFLPELPYRGVELVETTRTVEDRILIEARVQRLDEPMEAEQVQPNRFQVEVQNLDTGKTHNVIVKALSEIDARTLAVRMVARQEKVGEDRLVAVQPEIAS